MTSMASAGNMGLFSKEIASRCEIWVYWLSQLPLIRLVCFCPQKNSANFLRKEPHIAYRGRSRSFEADLEADLEAEIEAAEADLEAAEAAQGHPRPL